MATGWQRRQQLDDASHKQQRKAGEAASARGSENLTGGEPGTSPIQPASEADSNLAQTNDGGADDGSTGECSTHGQRGQQLW